MSPTSANPPAVGRPYLCVVHLVVVVPRRVLLRVRVRWFRDVRGNRQGRRHYSGPQAVLASPGSHETTSRKQDEARERASEDLSVKSERATRVVRSARQPTASPRCRSPSFFSEPLLPRKEFGEPLFRLHPELGGPTHASGAHVPTEARPHGARQGLQALLPHPHPQRSRP